METNLPFACRMRGFRISLAALASVAVVTLASCGGSGGTADAPVGNSPGTPPASAPGQLTLLAGAIAGSADGTPGRFNQPGGVAVDASGAVYVADVGNNTIRKIANGSVVTIAGTPGVSGAVDGTGAAARFNRPTAVAVDASGNVFVVDQGNNAIRKVTSAGVVTTLAGTAGTFGSDDGTGAAARFGSLKAITIDANGTLFVAEDSRIRKVTPAGVVSTLATGFNILSSIGLDGNGNIYASDSFASVIRKITPAGVATIYAGTETGTGGIAPFGFADGPLNVAKFDHPAALVADAGGILYVLDNNRLRKVTNDGFVTSLTVAGTGSSDLQRSSALTGPGIALAADGSIILSTPADNVVRKITPALVLVNVAGSLPTAGVVDGAGDAARFNSPGQLAVDGAGNVYVDDGVNNAIRKITPGGVVTTVAAAVGVHPPDARIINVTFDTLSGLALDKGGGLLVADPYSHLVRRVATDGSKTVAAGVAWPDGRTTGGFFGFTVNRSIPTGVVADNSGNLFVIDNGFLTDYGTPALGPLIRKVTAAGADSVLTCSDRPGCVLPTWQISAITIDAADNVYIAQYGQILKITSGGSTSVLAGGSAPGFADGTGTAASFGGTGISPYVVGPRALAVDGAGNVFVADTFNNAVRKITPAGVVTTIAGKAGATGIVPGTLPASLAAPKGIAVDAAGNIYVSSENAVLKIKP